jgi:cold shock protein
MLEAAGALSLESDLLALADVKPAKTLDDLIAGAKLRFSEELEQLYARTLATAAQPADMDLTDEFVVVGKQPKPAGNKRATGTVKWFSDDKGFGFITPDDGLHDLFVRHAGITAHGHEGLRKGARVTLELRDVDDVEVVVITQPKDSRRSRPRQTTPGRRGSRKS